MANNDNRDARLQNQGNAQNRQGREGGDRSLTEDRQVTDAERLEHFRRLFVAEKLPRIPDIKGYHPFWATTTNNADPIYRRLSMGYEFVKPEEVPGMRIDPIKTGEYSGCIMCGEMIAMKLPLDLYELYMTEVHSTQPLQEEAKLRSTLDVIEQEAARKKARLDVEEGSRELGRRTPRPRFEGIGRRADT